MSKTIKDKSAVNNNCPAAQSTGFTQGSNNYSQTHYKALDMLTIPHGQQTRRDVLDYWLSDVKH